MYKLIIFDLDGTLLDSIEDLANASNYALAKFGFKIHEVEAYKKFVGDGVYKLVERMLPKSHRDEGTKIKVKEAFDQYYKEHNLDCTKPYEGILNGLACLKEMNIDMAVVSNKAHIFTQELVALMFGKYIEIAYGQREGIPTKPNPYAVIEVIDRLGYQKEECIYVGDTSIDIQTGQNAGVNTVGVLWGFRTEEELRDAGADYLVKDMEEFMQIIKK